MPGWALGAAVLTGYEALAIMFGWETLTAGARRLTRRDLVAVAIGMAALLMHLDRSAAPRLSCGDAT